MKKNALIRIVLYTILIIVLLSLLIGGLTGSVLSLGGFSLFSMGTDLEHTGAGSADPAAISQLEINWAAGDITIVPSDADTISFSETPNEKYAMAWGVNDGKLTISFSDSLNLFGFRPGKASKDLTITVPADWIPQEIELNGAATRLMLSDLTIGTLEIDGASNVTDLRNCSVTSLSLDGASNQLTFEGSLQQLDSDGASNRCTLVLTNHPQEIELDGASSDLDLTLPADCGFTVDADGLSMDLDTDFEVTSSRKNHYRSGDGSCQISADGVSIHMSIRKAS